MDKLKQKQSFSTTTDQEEVERSDILTAASFSEDGSYIAIGDKGGRIWVYSTQEGKARCKPRSHENPNREQEHKNELKAQPEAYRDYDFYGQFQSHETEFDYLKSLEIEERINVIQWCPLGSNALTLLAANDRCIKLWKIFEKPVLEPTVSMYGHDRAPAENIESVKIPRLNTREILTAAIPRRTYTFAHTYSINSLTLSSDKEHFVSADDLRINLWNIETSSHTFCIADLKPENMEDLSCVIKHVEFHPVHCNIFSYGTSRGELLLADLRASSTVKKPSKMFHFACKRRDFFSDLTEQVLHSSFSKADINKVVVRDFKTVKVWDLRSEKEPLRTVPLPGFTNKNMEYLYQNEGIFDKFQVSTSANSSSFVTGAYNGEFVIADWETGDQHSYRVSSNRLPQDLLTSDTPLVGGGFPPKLESMETDSSYVKVSNPAVAPWLKSGVYFTNFHPKTESQVMVASTCDVILFGTESKANGVHSGGLGAQGKTQLVDNR